MILYHATPKRNLDSIKRNGINPDFSKGKEKVIWYHTKAKRHWAILHTQKRHKVHIDDIAIITVQITRSKLKRRRRRLWTTTETIHPTLITDAAEFAASPIIDDRQLDGRTERQAPNGQRAESESPVLPAVHRTSQGNPPTPPLTAQGKTSAHSSPPRTRASGNVNGDTTMKGKQSFWFKIKALFFRMFWNTFGKPPF